ncbi:Zinc finger Mcm10/DnaG-type [Trinorchestia longiramus]|nr:Zinc finger Mcm10/DnaG-type [Trinorchestia longiramus]
MDDFDEELDLDTLAELLDAEEEEGATGATSSCASTVSEETASVKSTVKSAPICAGSLGLELSDDEQDATEKPSTKKSSSAFCEAFSSQTLPEKTTAEPIDPLEQELCKMEARMAAIRAELSKKKKLDLGSTSGVSRKFTKLTLPVGVRETERNLSNIEAKQVLQNVKEQKNSIVHGGETDSEDDEDNRNPFESRYNSYGRSLKKNLEKTDSDQHSRKFTGNVTNVSPSVSNTSGHMPSRSTSTDTFSTLKSLALKRQEVVKKIKDGQSWQGANGSLVPVGGSMGQLTPAEKNAIRCPYSGIFVVSPQVMPSQMQERMEGRRHVSLSTIPLHLRGGEMEGDWVTIAVLVAKCPPKTSQKGTQYSIWQLSDLRDCTKTVGLFLFSGAHTGLWKTTIGSVVAILNAQVMKDRQGEASSNLVTLSINNALNLMIMGTARDLGWCKGRTKANGACRQFVNKSVCEFCVYHVQREYQKSSSKRADLQSSFSARGPKTQSLQQKVLGKDQVFYGGKLYTGAASAPAVPARPNASHKAKDLATLSSLKLKLKSDQLKEDDRKKSFVLKHLSSKEVSVVQSMVKNNDSLGDRLLAPTPGARNLLRHKTREDETRQQQAKRNQGLPVSLSAKDLLKMTHNAAQQRKIQQLKRQETSSSDAPVPHTPTLGRGFSPGQHIDLDVSPPKRSFDPAKAKALAILKRKGESLKSAEKNDVRSKVKTADPKFVERVQKRLRDAVGSGEEDAIASKKQKPDDESRSLLGNVDLNSEKIQAMLEKKSRHSNLVDAEEDAMMEKYYSKLEHKEQLEEKLATTMEVATNAVICKICDYQAVIQSQFCKDQGHIVKTVKATKRFYECCKCKRRTVTLNKMPVKPCGNCEQTSWRRVAMGKAKKGPTLDSEVLCLRGNEQKHFGGHAEKAYLHIDG